MIWPVDILGFGRSGSVPHAAGRDGHVYQLPSDDTAAAIDLEPGLYLVRVARVDSLAAWACDCTTANTGAADPAPPGGLPNVRTWFLLGDPAALVSSQCQAWLPVDRACTLWVHAGGSYDLDILIWRAGDCPPEYGGIPGRRLDRLPREV